MLHFDLLTARLPESWGNVAQGKTWEQEGLERRGKVSLSLSPPRGRSLPSMRILQAMERGRIDQWRLENSLYP